MSPMTRSELMALLDTCMLEAVRARWGADRDIEAVDLHIAFMGEPSGPLAASAQVVGGGRTVSFCQGQLQQPNGAVMAQAQATYRAVQRTTPLA
jgi:acyl-coenzyme A thioesterase PaaI-like protein